MTMLCAFAAIGSASESPIAAARVLINIVVPFCNRSCCHQRKICAAATA
jgi:hypothetical protein